MSRARESHRLFFAVWPDPATGERLGATIDALLAENARPGGRRVACERLHMTLHFLGSYAHYPQELIDRALASGGDVRAGPFVMEIETCGSFGRRVWWLGLRTCPTVLMDLRDWLGQALVARDVPLPETGRAWKPHVTILRDGSRSVPEHSVPIVPWQVRDFVLVHSTSGAGGGYTIIRHYPLRAG